jgi:hypothetical protein
VNILLIAERVLVKGWAADDEAKRLALTVRKLYEALQLEANVSADLVTRRKIETLLETL